jgi:hypothetical protein
MKVGGVSVIPRPEEVLVIPRGKQFLVFRAKPLPDMDEFDKLCPEPEPPGKFTKDGWEPEPGDVNYLQIKANYLKQRIGYMVIHTLADSNIEWTKVKVESPKTWAKWDEDFREAGFIQAEINRVLKLVLDTNSLSEDMIREARESFARGQARVQAASSGLQTEPESSPSGEPAPVSA